MSEDIVARLREVAVQEYKDGWAVFPVCDRAAEEIERLRREVNRWHLATMITAAELCLIHTSRNATQVASSAYREAAFHE